MINVWHFGKLIMEKEAFALLDSEGEKALNVLGQD